MAPEAQKYSFFISQVQPFLKQWVWDTYSELHWIQDLEQRWGDVCVSTGKRECFGKPGLV